MRPNAELVAKLEAQIEEIAVERKSRFERDNELEAKQEALSSEIMKAETGKGYGDTFIFEGKEYIIISEHRARLNKPKSNRKAMAYLPEYLRGEEVSPLTRVNKKKL